MTSIVDAVRGNVVESRHRVSIAVARADGVLVARSGDPDLITFWRSAAKPFQALPLVADGVADALGLEDDELALACASHNGEPEHVAVARRLLAKSGSTERDLACGPHPSLAEGVARAMAERGEQPTRLHSNCSGKHAGMLALARHHGWDRAGYALPEHAVQLRCVAEVAVWTGVPAAAIALATDGCGVPSFALPLRAMALAYARFAAAATAGPSGPGPRDGRGAAGRIVSAMRAHPFMLAGTGRLDTDVALASGGAILAKVGAEGVYCAALLGPGLGVALKVEDGDGRSVAPALLAVLDVLAPGAVRGAEAFRSPPLRNSVGDVVGRIVPRVRLERVRW
ncbi:MAG: asparaginase [Gemmatimonadetes bacterium]|nr:asparaginase [Gemmatimonadota bacterium]